MGRALVAAGIVASALLILSCQKKPAVEPLQAAVADTHSGFSISNDLPFWDFSGNAPAQKGAIQIGEKLSLLGQTRRAVLAGRERELVHVRRDTGVEGWARSDMVISSSILAVVTSDGAVIYSVPRNTAATTASIPRMTVLVIHSDSAGMPFIRVSGYDPVAQDFFRGIYLRNEGVSARPDDVQSAILLLLAAASKSPRQREAFLDSALKDYPGSLFFSRVQEALDALHAPPPPPPAETPPAAGQQTAPQAAQPSTTQPAAPQPTAPPTGQAAAQPTAPPPAQQ